MAAATDSSQSKGRSSHSKLIKVNDCSNLWNDDEIVKMDLCTACSVGQYSCVQQFLADGIEIVDLDQYNRDGWTPLMYAAYVGHDNIVNLLLDFPVDVNARSRTKKNYGATPLMLASSCGNETVVYFLLQNGAKIDAQDNRGWTSLFYATYQGHVNVVKMLLENDANREIREYDMEMTPLLVAAKEGHEVIFEVLLRHKASLQARTKLAEDARSLALRHGNNTVVNIIDYQLLQHQPNYLLRSEPGLSRDSTSDGNDIDTQSKVSGWLKDKYAIPITGIRDGPEAFAKLMCGQNEGKPINIPTPLGNQIHTAHVVGSPNHLPVTPDGTVGSVEEHFFINCGRTVESASLHKQLQKVNSAETFERNKSSLQHGNGMLQPQPTIAGFLEELKLTKYLPDFEKNKIDFSTLLTFTDKDLKDIGITLFGPRRKIFTALSHWKEEPSVPSSDSKAIEKLKLQAGQTEFNLAQLTSEVKQLQLHLSQEKDLRLFVEGCLMEEKAKLQGIYCRVGKLQEHWKHMEGEVEMLKDVNKELENHTNLAQDWARELHDKLHGCITNLTGLVHQSLTGISSISLGSLHNHSGNSSESSGNSSC